MKELDKIYEVYKNTILSENTQVIEKYLKETKANLSVIKKIIMKMEDKKKVKSLHTKLIKIVDSLDDLIKEIKE